MFLLIPSVGAFIVWQIFSPQDMKIPVMEKKQTTNSYLITKVYEKYNPTALSLILFKINSLPILMLHMIPDSENYYVWRKHWWSSCSIEAGLVWLTI